MSVGLGNKQLTIALVVILSLLAQTAFSQSKLEDLLPEIERVIEKGKQNIWDEIEPNEPLWNMPPWLGTFFLSEYYFELKGTSGRTQHSPSTLRTPFSPSSMRHFSRPSC
jgi:hypothetical protein